jgi:succinoglycan biosynthesis protein ExoH
VTCLTVDQNISSRINLMRILLISGIVFVHVPFNPATSPFLGTNGWFDWLRVFLGDSLFRVGVPCLSMISGYLLFRKGMQSFDYGKTLQSKAKTVLLPFLLWNLGLFAAVWLVQSVGIGQGYFHDVHGSSVRDLLTLAFAAEDLPVNLPLYFLRDLIVCIALSPLLALLVRRFAVPTLAILFVFAVLPGVAIPIVIKKTILFSFTMGIFLALRGADLKMLDRFAVPGTVVTIAAAVALSIAQYLSGPDYPWMVDLARNALSVIGAFGFWMISAIAIRSRTGQRLAATGSLSFWIFCAHYPVLMVLWMVWNKIAGVSAYPVFYLGAVAVTLTVMVVTNALAMRLMPSLYQVLTGSRGRKEKLANAGASRPLGSGHSPIEPNLSQQRR